ncbi:MAG: TetR family transcriptional regulator [Cellvibrionaceae bacterium]
MTETSGKIMTTPTKNTSTGKAPGNRPGRPKGTNTEATRQRILDAAEVLFSENSFNGVTIRQIAKLSAVDTALLHYHFGNKHSLLETVFERRAHILNNERMDALNHYDNAHIQPTTEGAIKAFIGPLLEKATSGDKHWKYYFALVAQVNNTPELGGDIMHRHFDPVVQRMLDIIQKALPEADRGDLYWSFQLFSGAIMLTLSQSGRVDRLSNGLCNSEDLVAAFDRLIPFATAGFEAVCKK